MHVVTIGMWVGALAMLAAAWRRRDGSCRRGLSQTIDYLILMTPRVVVAMFVASFAAELIPGRLVSQWLGANSGISGILIASISGLFIPAGGVVVFPLALAMLKVGAGIPQLVAFLTSWEVFAVNRTLAFELPILGSNFVAVRLTASFLLPPVSGATAAALMHLFYPS